MTMMLSLACMLLLCAHSSAAPPELTDNCRCRCSNAGSSTTNTFWSQKSKPSECTINKCRSDYSSCPDTGAHNDGSSVEADWKDCHCQCSFSSNTAPNTLSFSTNNVPGKCTASACSSHFSSCPDTGAHNADAVVVAHYAGVEEPMYVASSSKSTNLHPALQGNSHDDCQCECCFADDCPKSVRGTFRAGSRGRCTEDGCRSHFSFCPDTGAHNDGSEVAANFHDCTCGCKHAGENSQVYFFLTNTGDKALCTADFCRASFQGCPDTGAHNAGGQVKAFWNGGEPKEEDDEEEEKKIAAAKEEGAWPWAVGFGVAAFLICVLVGIYAARRAGGYKWVHMNDLADISPSSLGRNKGTGVASQNNA